MLLISIVLTPVLAYDYVVRDGKEYWHVYSAEEEALIEARYTMPDVTNIQLTNIHLRDNKLYLSWEVQVSRGVTRIATLSNRRSYYLRGLTRDTVFADIVEDATNKFASRFGAPNFVREYETLDTIDNFCYDWDTYLWGVCR